MQQDPNLAYSRNTAKINRAPHQPTPGSAAPATASVQQAQAAHPRSQPVSTANNANAGAAQAPVPGVRGGQHARANHLPYGQVALGAQYGSAQGRRPVHQQSPHPGPYFQPYGNNMNPAASLYANNYMGNPTYNSMASPYSTTPYYNRGPTPPVAQGSIGTAPQMPTRDFQPQAVGTQPRVQVPPKRSKAIPIVNPDTKEEVKISKAAQPKTAPAPQVSPPVRKPLEVVAPSEVSDSTQLAGDTQNSNKSKELSEKEMKTVPVKDSTEVAAKVVAGAEEASNASIPSAKDNTSSLSPLDEQKPASAATVAEKGSFGSDISENKVEVADKEVAPAEPADSYKDVSEAKTAALVETGENPALTQDIKCEADPSDVSGSAELKADRVSDLPEKPSAPELKSTSAGEVQVIENTTESPEKRTTSESTAHANPDSDSSPASDNPSLQPEPQYSSPPKRTRPASPQWVAGQRRVYSIPFLRGMKEFADEISAQAYNSKLRSVNISVSQKGSSHHGGARRGGRGMGGDPRGRGVLEPGGGYNVARGGGVLGGGGYNMSDFDLSGARNRAPPPHASNRAHYDPRGSRSQDGGRGSRSYGPIRGGVGPLDSSDFDGPKEKLAKSENHWARKKENDSEIEAKTKLMKSLLNKLTLEKFEKITSKILKIELKSPEECQAIVAEIFEKTLFEPKFASMYAMLCKQLDISTRDMFDKFSSDGKTYTFRKVLLRLCQVEFQKKGVFKPEEPGTTGESAGGDEAVAGPGGDNASTANQSTEVNEEEAKKKSNAKRRMLANLVFIGELFLVDLINEKIIHAECVQTLLKLGINEREEDVLEALCKLLSSIGKKLSGSNMTNRNLVPQYFEKIVQLSQDGSLVKRSRYMLMDLVDLRRNNWVPRREEDKAKKIKEIHDDIAKEDRHRAQMQAKMRHGGRGPRGGGREDNHRSRGFNGPQPSMNMTMASQRTSSHTNRANSTLEKFASLREGRSSGNEPKIRLGPGASRSSANGGWNNVGRSGASSRNQSTSSGTGGTQLRPQRTGFDILAGSDSAPQNSGGRRGNRFNTLSTQSKNSSPAEPVNKGPKLLSEEALRKKAKSAMTEHWETKLDDELKAVVETEVGMLNAEKFVEFSLRAALNEKISKRPEGVPYFQCLINNTIITGEAIASGFSSVLEDMDNIVVDDPRAGEFIALYLAAVFETGKMGSDGYAGLEFVKSSMVNSIGRPAIKFIVHLLEEIRKLSSNESDEVTRNKLVGIYDSLGVDLVSLAAVMYPFPARGLGYLEDLLKEKNLAFMLPTLHVEKLVLDKISTEVPGDKIVAEVKAIEGVDDALLRSPAFAKTVVLGSFTLFFDQFCGAKGIVDRTKDGPGKLIKLCHGNQAPPTEVQYSVLLGVHDFLHKLLSKREVPELHNEHKGKKHAHLAFEALYDADIVEEEAFMKWKSDETDIVMNIGGKDKVLLQTASWFHWLATAEEEAS